MIVIKNESFEMVQVNSGPFFNFSVLTTVNKGKDTERSEMKLVAYGLPFEVCMKHIVGMEMAKHEGTMTASEYITKYKEAVNNVAKLVTHVDKIAEFDHE